MFESLRRLLATSSALVMTGLLMAGGGEAEPLSDLTDPTAPPAAALAPKPPNTEASRDAQPLRLSAIFFSGGRRVAIIDGQRVQENDTIGGAEILEIAPTAATIRKDEEIVQLELVGGHVKQTPARSSIRSEPGRHGAHGDQP